MISRYYSFLLILFITLALIAACNTETADDASGRTFRVSDIKPALYSDDHNSEGFLVQKSDGKLMLIFRRDPGSEGHHIGTNGYIAKITYDPDSDTWGEVETIYNSHRYDDRNIHGGITRDGRIVIFFRHMDIIDGNHITEGRYFLYSDDDGETWNGPLTSESWSAPELPDPQFGVWGTSQMFYNEDISRYAILGYGNQSIYITYSEDGSVWDELSFVKEDDEKDLTEIAGAWTGDNKMIALIRDNRVEANHQLLQIESHDNGKSWSEPEYSNIPPDHWAAAPQLIYDEKRDLLIALTSDRYTRDHSVNSIFIFSARPEEVYGQAGNWKFEHELQRPWARGTDSRPLNQSFYGYPTIAPINDHEYLVVFTERATIDGSEQADLYYFRIIFEDH